MPSERRRPCATCGRNRREDFFVSAKGKVCSDCRKKRQQETARRNHVERTYGLTPEDHDRLLEHQGGVCAICFGERRYRLHVDHDHADGLVRGLICRNDNRILALVRDDDVLLQSMVRYLHVPPARLLGIRAMHEDWRTNGPDA